ncbi:MAG TPA: hypothetical protein V6D21_13075 [Candidatus Obscuribacterales bacterium]
MARKGGSGISLAKGGFTSAEKGSEGQSKSGLGGSLGGSVTVADYGDVEIKGVVDIDISPLRGDISYDTSTNEVGVSGGIKIPGGVVGVGGGVGVDLDTGEITGGSVSLGIGGADVEVSISECEQTLQVTYFGVGFAVSKDTCDNGDEDGNDDESGGNDGYNPLDEPFSPPPDPPKRPQPNSEDYPDTPGWLVYYSLNGYYWWNGSNRDPACNIIGGSFSTVRVSSNLPDIIFFGDNDSDFNIPVCSFTLKHSTTPFGKKPNEYVTGTSGSQTSSRSKGFLWELAQGISNTKYSGEGNVSFYWAGNIKIHSRASMYFANSFWPTRSITHEIIWVDSLKKGIANLSYIWRNGIVSSSSKGCYNSDNITSKVAGGTIFLGAIIHGNRLSKEEALKVQKNTLRRPIPPSKNMSECCDASISLMRKIAKVLAVDEMLSPMKTSGKILKKLEKEIDKVLAEPDLVMQMDNYLELNTFLALLSNRKVAVAVGVDELEFEDDQKEAKFHYLRWLKDYNEGKTPLDYQEWLTAKNKEEGLKASTTQFKSIPQLILAELYNSKITSEVLRVDNLKKEGMKIPNELFAPEGVGNSLVYDYPNILKKIIQILDLNTVSPFTAVLKDADPAKEGDQTMTKFYPDATSAFKEVVELLLESKIDSATRLNILIRQSVLATQQQVAMLETLSIAYTIMYGLGLPYNQKGSHFVAPFDISPNSPKEKADKKRSGGKGFNPKDKEEEARVQSAMNSLNENRESSTEKLLPDFLNTVRQEYLHTYFSDSGESMWYYIMSIFMKR